MARKRAQTFVRLINSIEPLEPRLLFFSSANHQAMTNAAFSFLNSSVLSTIVAQHAVQDKSGNNGDIPQYHFDGSYFNEGATTINSRYSTILNNANPSSFNSNTVAVEFGKLNHAVEDFYAHSNWVEDGQTMLVDSGLGMWNTLAPYSVVHGVMMVEGEDLHPVVSPYGTATFTRSSHVVKVSFTGGATFAGVISGSWALEKIPDSVEVTHDYLNKDNSTKAFFQPAYDLGFKQSQHEFARLGALIKSRYGDAGVDKLLSTWVKSDNASQNAARALLDLPPGDPDGGGGGGGGGGGTTQNVSVIAAGASWKYLDNGSNQGTAWDNLGFDDSAWKSGNAELGYGDGDEATKVSFGSSSSNKFTTTYFRKSFSLTDASKITGLSLQLVRDDGAVVYVNGTEVFRSNMPTGTITSSTFATSAIEDSGWKTATINPSLLTSGDNTIAVEIHQSDKTSSDISFNFKLDAVATGDPGVGAPSGGSGGGGGGGGGGSTTTTQTFIATGSAWNYLDNGTNQGTAWDNNGFDDSTWKSGAAELGYGDGDEKTTVSFGGSSSNKFVTTYFRKSFNVDDASKVTALGLRLLRDDGAVVYLNGTEVYRTNMPTGSIAYNTLASNAIEDTTWYTANINPALLASGNNVIAVEIHQADRGSSDISFNFELTGTVTTPAAGASTLSVTSPTSSMTNLTTSTTDKVINLVSDPTSPLI